MTVIICPGIHPPHLTQSFLRNLGVTLRDYRLLPTDRYAPYSGLDVLRFLHREFGSTLPTPTVPLLFISFSAGVVGAIAAAWAWRVLGGEIKAFVALDGWGVPLQGDFPIYRLSHDEFTHWSSALLGAGVASFYADPPVAHLDLWRSPHTAIGQVTSSVQSAHHLAPQPKMTAAQFLQALLLRYEEVRPNDTPILNTISDAENSKSPKIL